LGNIGERYAGTRHNVGFWLIDALAGRLGVRVKKPFGKRFAIGKLLVSGRSALHLVKPLTFMNRSGEIIHSLLRYTGCRVEDLLVVCDTLDLDPGECRLKRKGSSAGHKGLDSIIRHAGTSEIPRLFVGIGRPGPRSEVISYVLKPPARAERDQIDMGLRRAADAILELPHQPMERVMNALNEKHRAS